MKEQHQVPVEHKVICSLQKEKEEEEVTKKINKNNDARKLSGSYLSSKFKVVIFKFTSSSLSRHLACFADYSLKSYCGQKT